MRRQGWIFFFLVIIACWQCFTVAHAVASQVALFFQSISGLDQGFNVCLLCLRCPVRLASPKNENRAHGMGQCELTPLGNPALSPLLLLLRLGVDADDKPPASEIRRAMVQLPHLSNACLTSPLLAHLILVKPPHLWLAKVWSVVKVGAKYCPRRK